MPYYLELLLTVGNLVFERHREMVFDLGRDLLGDLKGDLCLDLLLDLWSVHKLISSLPVKLTFLVTGECMLFVRTVVTVDSLHILHDLVLELIAHHFFHFFDPGFRTVDGTGVAMLQ
jgi:hypothetical protein